MPTFLKLPLLGNRPDEEASRTVLVNVDHIIRIKHRDGSKTMVHIVAHKDEPSHFGVDMSLEQMQQLLIDSGSRVLE